MYFVYISNACTYSRDARRIRNVRATPTRDRDSGGKEEKYSLSFSPSSDIYIYIIIHACIVYISFARSVVPVDRCEAERKAREKTGPRGIRPTGGRYTRAEDEDSLDRWPVSIVARNAKGERSRKTTEREEATLRTTLCNAVCCAR